MGTGVPLSVVIMAYNERASIERQVLATLAFLDSASSDGEVVVVDDGSRDGTGEAADGLAASDGRIRVVRHPRNLGMGVAIRSGYAAATREYVTQLPGDGQVVPTTLSRLLVHVPAHDLVLSTYTRRDDGLLRAFVTAGYQATARVLLGDPCRFTGTMVFRRSLLDGIELSCQSFLVNVELPLRLMRMGVEPAWVTIEAVSRAHGRSKVLSAARVARVVREMVALRLAMSRWNPPPR